MIPALGGRKLRDLRAEGIDKWLVAKSATLSTSTLQRLHSCLNRTINRAMARDRVRRNVVAALCSVPAGQPAKPSKVRTVDQADAVLTPSGRTCQMDLRGRDLRVVGRGLRGLEPRTGAHGHRAAGDRLLRGRPARGGAATGAAVTGKLIRVTTALAVAGVAGVAAIISYRHAYELVSTHGETGLTARLIPLTVDGLIVAASMLILDASRRNRPGPPESGSSRRHR